MFIPQDTKQALGTLPPDNRSLYFDRFADPTAKDSKDRSPRKDWFETGCKRTVPPDAGKRIRDGFFPTGTRFIYGQLKGRLMVNMAGGVMENAGLCLDRYGVPYIPGSAVKGCARRMALHALHDWTQAGVKPDSSDACFDALSSFDSPEAMLAQIASTFGWGDLEWSNTKSDFLWAVSGKEEVLAKARELLGAASTSSHGGSVTFFAAYPNTDPGLELDILTCHHPEYYGDSAMQFAADTEEPNPVTFPAVRAQSGSDHFTFALHPLRQTGNDLVSSAEIWLTLGLELFGLGAKTAAGYGWFETKEITCTIRTREENRRREALRILEADRLNAEADARKAAQVEEARALEGLSDSEKQDLLLVKLTETAFYQKLVEFVQQENLEKEAIVRALHTEARLGAWNQFKEKASKKGGKFSQAEQAIRVINKTLKLGKMP